MQERAEVSRSKNKTIFSGVSTKAAAVNETVKEMKSLSSKVRVVHGANEGYYALSGKTVGDVRKGLRDIFNLPGDAIAQVDGKEVDDEFILDSNQNLEFSKASGVKG